MCWARGSGAGAISTERRAGEGGRRAVGSRKMVLQAWLCSTVGCRHLPAPAQGLEGKHIAQVRCNYWGKVYGWCSRARTGGGAGPDCKTQQGLDCDTRQRHLQNWLQEKDGIQSSSYGLMRLTWNTRQRHLQIYLCEWSCSSTGRVSQHAGSTRCCSCGFRSSFAATASHYRWVRWSLQRLKLRAVTALSLLTGQPSSCSSSRDPL